MGQTLKIEYDMEDMVLGIKEAVKEELNRRLQKKFEKKSYLILKEKLWIM